ncbi:hypothetical protein R1sor_024903 [Riccia sorocarpa]|uniref:Uncharacterized protein n=1 Tax=Riccia sorocarpa TaxID=122646 RepID=A0ABD3GRR8_9MARC
MLPKLPKAESLIENASTTTLPDISRKLEDDFGGAGSGSGNSGYKSGSDSSRGLDSKDSTDFLPVKVPRRDLGLSLPLVFPQLTASIERHRLRFLASMSPSRNVFTNFPSPRLLQSPPNLGVQDQNTQDEDEDMGPFETEVLSDDEGYRSNEEVLVSMSACRFKETLREPKPPRVKQHSHAKSHSGEVDTAEAIEALQLHRKQQAEERAAADHRRWKALDTPEDCAYIQIDGMDQKKTALPHFSKQPKSVDGAALVGVHLVGAMTSPRPGRKRGSYVNWFLVPKEWKDIKAALEVTRFNFRVAVRFLHRKYNKPGVANPYLKLKESTIRGWFLRDKRTLKPRFKALAESLERQFQFGPELVGEQGPQPPRRISSQRGPGRLGEFGPAVWSRRPELEVQLVLKLQQQRTDGAVLNGNTIKAIAKAFFLLHYPEILQERGGLFQMSLNWIQQWVRETFHWSFRASTTAAQKLPPDWVEQGNSMCLRVAYLVFSKKIPEELIMNMDQTRLFLMPMGNERTYAAKGSRDVAVTGRDDKRQVTVCVSSAASGELLRF